MDGVRRRCERRVNAPGFRCAVAHPARRVIRLTGHGVRSGIGQARPIDFAQKGNAMISTPRIRRRLTAGVSFAIVGATMPLLSVATPVVQAISPDVVISQVYGGGGNAGATYTHDFVELYNRGSAAVVVDGWSVQYASATGTGNFAPATISGTIQPGQRYLVQLAAGNGGTTPLPAPDATGSLALSGTAGKAIVARTPTSIGCNGGSNPCTAEQAGLIVDLVGFGGANFSETAPTPPLSNTTAAIRDDGGCVDTDDNAADFTVAAPEPRNSAAPLTPCGGPPPADVAPSVSSVTPADDATSVSTNAAVTVTFSEPVTLGAEWFTLDCTATGPVAGTTTGGPTTYTVDPAADLAFDETCTLTILAEAVSDIDAEDPPDTMAADATSSFSTIAADPCSAEATPIPAVQGDGPAAAITGTVTVRGVVVSDDEGPSPALRGFNLQDPVGDGDPATSDGIFVFNGANTDLVSLGDVVTVTGRAVEFNGQTQIDQLASVVVCGTGTATPAEVTLPAPDATSFEQFEGMLVQMPQELSVSEHFQLGRFGEIVVSSGGRLPQPTNVVAPGPDAIALQAANDLNRIVVDDNRSDQNPETIRLGRNGEPLSASNTLRGGDTVTGLVGVMSFSFDFYRIMPFNALGGGAPNFEGTNPRPDTAPDVGGTIQVAGINVLNYFNTFNPGCQAGVGGPPTDCRGADSPEEFARQVPKTVEEILGTGAEVIGINEIENDGYGVDSAIAQLVGALNDATAPGTYAFIDADAGTGQINSLGTDAIKVGVIYQPAAVTPVGQTAVLNTVEFVNGGDPAPRSRPAIAQAFEQNGTGGVFTAVVNHLKSKGSACSVPDSGDGQANCNQVRLNAVNELIEWLDGDPTGTGDTDHLLVGDLNSYAMEDPITTLEAAGYTNLVEQYGGADAYSYVFGAQWGYLDHALGSSSMTAQVTGVEAWHVNADEPGVLDYNTNFKPANLIESLYAPDQYRSSDHDPVIVGLDLAAPLRTDVTAAGLFVSPRGAIKSEPRRAGVGLFALQTSTGTDDTTTGQLAFGVLGARFNVTGTVTTSEIDDATATISGTATVNGRGGHTFVATAQDGRPDRFGLVVREDAGTVVYDSGVQSIIGIVQFRTVSPG